MKTYTFSIIRPGGNDTCLVHALIRDPLQLKRINDEILQRYPTVEQVGFVDLSTTSAELVMTGEEFCGNATRSAAWLALKGKPGKLKIKVSGVQRKLQAGVTASNEAFAQMPIYPDVSKVTQDDTNRIVEMEGITHYINFNTEQIAGLSTDEIKEKSMELIRAKNLDQFAASGIMYCKKECNLWRVTPIVYVRAINTLYAETACGSGTTALGLVLALQKGTSITEVPIIQPTNAPIKVTVEYDGTSFGYAQISGPISEILKGTI